MSFRRGATLPVATTLGHAESSDLGPSAGNGFYKRWPDDLALLADAGVADIRLTIDWARLQAKPGEFSEAWAERYEQMLDASEAIGIRVWATLQEAGVPRWIDNEGGLEDDDTLVRWWPRWVERVADRLGDRIDGWLPFAVAPDDLPRQAWSDTWGILGGGDAPVVLSVRAAVGTSWAASWTGEFDLLGVALDAAAGGEIVAGAEPDDDVLRRAGQRWADSIGAAGDAIDRPVLVSEFSPDHDDVDVIGSVTERLVETLDGLDDAPDVAFFDPGIAGAGSTGGLFDVDRAPRPAAGAFLHQET